MTSAFGWQCMGNRGKILQVGFAVHFNGVGNGRDAESNSRTRQARPIIRPKRRKRHCSALRQFWGSTMDLSSSVAQVGAMLAPRNIVVVGASDRAGSWPAVVWETVHAHGFKGPIYAINPNRDRIGEERCYRDFVCPPGDPGSPSNPGSRAPLRLTRSRQERRQGRAPRPSSPRASARTASRKELPLPVG